MDMIEVIQKRASTRAYRPDPVEEEKLHLLLESMRMAPTAANRQPFKFIIIHTAGKETELRKIYNAPVVCSGSDYNLRMRGTGDCMDPPGR